MKKALFACLMACLTLFTLWLPSAALSSEGKLMETTSPLNQRQQSIITIAAFTASGDLDALNNALQTGLDAGLSVNEIKEVLVQMYAYCGFPRSLNGLGTFMALLDTRQAQGITDVMGPEATPVSEDFDRDQYGAKVRAQLAGLEQDISGAKWQQFSPVMDQFLKEHLFADIFVRDVISHQDRELATIAALANMSGTEGQLAFHLSAAMNSGLTAAQLKAFVAILNTQVNSQQAQTANQVLNNILQNKTK
nr:carboxymuconolactone decarboxylase family protein [uncultured Desulfuromonas sp.]